MPRESDAIYAGKNVDGVKLIYAKVKADGSLDLKDSYPGALLGYKGATSQVLAYDEASCMVCSPILR